MFKYCNEFLEMQNWSIVGRKTNINLKSACKQYEKAVRIRLNQKKNY